MIKSYLHQKKSLAFAEKLNTPALLLEMGTGKSRIMIHWVHIKSPRRVLLICPKSIMEKERDEILLHSPDPEKDHILIAKGLKDAREKILLQGERHTGNKICWVIINYEAVHSFLKQLYNFHPDCIVLDESTRIKNPRAIVSRCCHSLGQGAVYRTILTGTPITQSPIDIWSQYHFLCPGLFSTNYWAFRSRYAVMGGYLQKQIVAYNHLEEINKKVYEIGYRVLKKDCLELPDKVYETLTYELSDEQKRVYVELKKEFCSEFKSGIVSVQQAITKILRLSQIASGFIRLDGSSDVTYFDKNPKLELLEETLDDIGPRKVVVFCRFLPEIATIEKRLNTLHRPYLTFYGETKERDKVLEEFHTSSRPYVFICQIQTGGFGIDLVQADTCIYYSNSYSLEQRLQSEDRLHRIGQKNRVTYIDLVGEKTLEKSIISLLKRKKNLANIITRDNIEGILGGDER